MFDNWCFRKLKNQTLLLSHCHLVKNSKRQNFRFKNCISYIKNDFIVLYFGLLILFCKEHENSIGFILKGKKETKLQNIKRKISRIRYMKTFLWVFMLKSQK